MAFSQQDHIIGMNLNQYDPYSHSWMFTGQEACEAITNHPPRLGRIGFDIETAGLAERSMQIRCVSFAWESTFDGSTIAVVLNAKSQRDRIAIREIFDKAKMLIGHNMVFDVPVLVNNKLLTFDQIDKIWDTLVMFRMIETSNRGGRSLEDSVDRFTNLENTSFTIQEAFKTLGFSTYTEGFYGMSINSPIWKMGSASDSVGALKLFAPLYKAVLNFYANSAAKLPMPHLPDNQEWFAYLIKREQRTNRIMLKISARGILVDLDYLENFVSGHQQKLDSIRKDITDAGLDPDAGNLGYLLVQKLYDRGELPKDWKKTSTGRLVADKKALAVLEHPLAVKIRDYSVIIKDIGYLEKIRDMSNINGRVYPQANILGASATGRMSYSDPPLQQFSADARPILIADEGHEWVSDDWKAIEPTILFNVAGDRDMIIPYNKGEDLYKPLQDLAGISRKSAKGGLLATQYGTGDHGLAGMLGCSDQEAKDIRAAINDAMHITVKYIKDLTQQGNELGLVRTIDGRALTLLPNTMQKGKRRMNPTAKYRGYTGVNYTIQGTGASILSEFLNRVDDAGLADSISLAIHDEVIVDKEAVNDVDKLMKQPPNWLTDRVGETVILRTDQNDLGKHWQKC